MKINIDALESGVIKYIERIRQCKVINFNSFTGQEEVAMTEDVMEVNKRNPQTNKNANQRISLLYQL